MKRVLVLVSCMVAVIAFSSGPASAGSHSGPEALAKGDGEVSSTSTENQPIMRQICDTTNFCYGEFPVATRVTVTETEESFDFSAKLGPKSSTLDPTSGAIGSMKLDYTSTATTSVVAGSYYQFCNRLAVAQFLAEHGVRARLLFIYFTGDQVGGAECPATEAGWHDALAAQDAHIGLSAEHPARERVHKLFLPAIANLHSSGAETVL